MVIFMLFKWTDYNTSMTFVEDWLDDEAVRVTGLDDGFRDFYEYWKNENIPDINYWCKVVSENDKPFAVITIGKDKENFIFMEFVIAPGKRNQGKGTLILKELLKESKIILGQEIESAEAVIFPSNPASQKAFKKAGFVFSHADEDDDAFYYVFGK